MSFQNCKLLFPDDYFLELFILKAVSDIMWLKLQYFYVKG